MKRATMRHWGLSLNGRLTDKTNLLANVCCWKKYKNRATAVARSYTYAITSETAREGYLHEVRQLTCGGCRGYLCLGLNEALAHADPLLCRVSYGV